jgi:hypothetical protein
MFTRAVRLGLAVLFCVGIGIGWASPSWADGVECSYSGGALSCTGLPSGGVQDIEFADADHVYEAWSNDVPVAFPVTCPGTGCAVMDPGTYGVDPGTGIYWPFDSGVQVGFTATSDGDTGGDSPTDAVSALFDGILTLPNIMLMIAAAFVVPWVVVLAVYRGWPLLKSFF